MYAVAWVGVGGTGDGKGIDGGSRVPRRPPDTAEGDGGETFCFRRR